MPKGNPGKRRLRTASLFTRWMELVGIDKKTSDESIDLIAVETGISKPTLRAIAYKEEWYKLSQRFLPAMRAMEPTSTTSMDVLDVERKSYLQAARKIADKLLLQLEYFGEQFQKAKENDNHILASEMAENVNKLALAFTRAQMISMHATCDSGAATAITESSGKPNLNQAINLYLSPMMSKPRISQPGAQPLQIELPPSPAQGNEVSNGKH